MPEFELSDDGEFAEPVDTDFGVYSAQRRTKRAPFFLLFSGIFTCALIAAVYFGFSY